MRTASRDEDGLGLPALEEARAGGAERGVVADLDARGLRRLGAVRLHERGAAVVGEVGALRIDDPGERRARVGLRERREQVRPDHALGVVRHHHHVAACAPAQHEVAYPARPRPVEHARRLVVEAHHLLLVRDDARLLRRARLVRDDDALGAGAERAQRGGERPPRRVVAHDPARRRPAPERRDVAHHVPRAARALVLPGHVHDGHRRLGRDALDLPPHEAIEHQVAHHQHAHPGEAPDQLREPPSAHAHGRSS